MHGTEMTFYGSQQVAVNDVVQFHLESTLAALGRRDIFRILAAAKKYMEFLVLICHVQGANSRIPAREFKVVAPDFLESLRMKQLAKSIATAGEQHAEIFG